MFLKPINTLNEQAARSTGLTKKLVYGNGFSVNRMPKALITPSPEVIIRITVSAILIKMDNYDRKRKEIARSVN